MPLFNFTVVNNYKLAPKKSSHQYTTVELGLSGVVNITIDGSYFVEYNGEHYEIEPKFLDLHNKQIVYVFNNKEKSKIVKIIKDKDNPRYYGFPYMAVSPGIYVEGSIVRKELGLDKGKQYFKINRISDRICFDIRKEFKRNYKTIIKAYNERNCPDKTN